MSGRRGATELLRFRDAEELVEPHQAAEHKTAVAIEKPGPDDIMIQESQGWAKRQAGNELFRATAADERCVNRGGGGRIAPRGRGQQMRLPIRGAGGPFPPNIELGKRIGLPFAAPPSRATLQG